MTTLHKKWSWCEQRPELQNVLKQNLNITSTMAQLLINRGITDESEAHRFLYGGPNLLHDPFLLKDMEQACLRIAKALQNHERITIYGDYDVDGITSCSILYLLLLRLGAEVNFYIPERQSEGYGLNENALRTICDDGTKLIITVDCGISANREISNYCREIDIIVTDHHEAPDSLPAALAIINPKQPNCNYPDKNLAGVGVAFKLCQALWRFIHPDQPLFLDYIEIVAIGTVADIVPLVGENRILVKTGLDILQRTDNIGLRSLIETCRLQGEVDTTKVGYVIAPRLNAVGRISHASAGVELLTCNNYERASQIAAMLEQENSQRQQIEKTILSEAEQVLIQAREIPSVIVIAGEGWHSGVIGIVASRLVDKYYRPVVIISIQDGIGKGSCRSIPSFDIYSALKENADVLLQFGGHQQAAGLSILPENISILTERLNELAQSKLSPQDYVPEITVDTELAIKEINDALLDEIATLAPHGVGNPWPVFSCHHLQVINWRIIGKDSRHLKVKVKQDHATCDVVAWNMADVGSTLNKSNEIKLAYRPEYNYWQGTRIMQLNARDIKLVEQPTAKYSWLKIKDARSMDKLAYIIDLLNSGKRGIIVVQDKENFDKLHDQLRLFLQENQIVIINDFNEDLTGDKQYNFVIVYDFVYMWKELIKKIKVVDHMAQEITIYVLCNENDIIRAQVELKELAIDRSLIGAVYLSVKQLSVNTEWSSLNSVAGQLLRVYAMALTSRQISLALSILAEMNLVEHADGLYRMLPLPIGKLQLIDSQLYQTIQRWKKDFIEIKKIFKQSNFVDSLYGLVEKYID